MGSCCGYLKMSEIDQKNSIVVENEIEVILKDNEISKRRYSQNNITLSFQPLKSALKSSIEDSKDKLVTEKLVEKSLNDSTLCKNPQDEGKLAKNNLSHENFLTKNKKQEIPESIDSPRFLNPDKRKESMDIDNSKQNTKLGPPLRRGLTVGFNEKEVSDNESPISRRSQLSPVKVANRNSANQSPLLKSPKKSLLKRSKTSSFYAEERRIERRSKKVKFKDLEDRKNQHKGKNQSKSPH